MNEHLSYKAITLVVCWTLIREKLDLRFEITLPLTCYGALQTKVLAKRSQCQFITILYDVRSAHCAVLINYSYLRPARDGITVTSQVQI